MRVEFPSGMAADMMPMTGAEMAIVAEQIDGASSSNVDSLYAQLINACWSGVIDPGPYSFLKTGDYKPDWKRMLKGDLLSGLIAMRQLSIEDGDDYGFNVRCEEQSCRATIKWNVVLSRLPMRKLDKEVAQRFSQGIPETITFMNRKVQFRPAMLGQEEEILLIMKRHDRKKVTGVEVAACQLVDVEGIKPTAVARWKWVGSLKLGEVGRLIEEMNEHDCGLETAFEVKCGECKLLQEVNLPLGKQFWAQKKRTKPKSLLQASIDDEDPRLPSSFDGSSTASPSTSGAATALPSGGIPTGAEGTAA